MKRIFISVFVLFQIVQFAESQDYYWSSGKKHFLTNEPNLFVAKPRAGISDNQILQKVASKKEIKSAVRLKDAMLLSTQISQTAELRDLNTFEQFIPVKKMGEINLYFTGEILLQPKESVSIDRIIAFVNNAISIKKKSKYNTYVMNVANWDSLFIYANRIYESGMVMYSHPNFIAPIERMQTPNDPRYQEQYYLNNAATGIDINAPEAWQINTGGSIRVAVIDDGVEAHEDIAGRVLTGFTASTSANNPDTQGGPNANNPPANLSTPFGHGQCCAGIIAATHNNIGIRGIAPNANIIPINIFNDWFIGTEWINGQPFNFVLQRETANDIAIAIDEAWDTFGADVLSNSWGYRTTNADEILDSDEIIFAINRAQTQGRGGLGSVVIFASGNSNNRFSGVTFPANVNGVIAVGAVNRNGTVWNYSSRGNELDVVAPSGNTDHNGDVVTIDRMDANGYETGNYTSRFGGTSAACPQVAGIAALILSVRPDLRQDQVRHAIESTCTKLSAYSFSNNSAHPNGSWNNQVGHGLVNAYAAVYSVAPKISGPDIVCSSGAQFTINNIPENPNVIWDYDHSLLEPMDGSDTGYPKSFKSIGEDDGFGFGPKGTGWISATVNGVPLQPIILHVGAPSNPVMQGPSTVSPGVYYRYSFSLNDVAEVTDIEWVASPNATISGSSYSVSIRFGQRGYGAVSVGVTNQCGQSFGFKMVSVGYSNPFLLYPNPASNILNIEIDPEALTLAQASLPAATDGKQLKQDPAFDIRLYDNQGALLRHKKTKGGTVQFNVASLPNGIYYLHIYDGVNEKPEIRQIVVEH